MRSGVGAWTVAACLSLACGRLKPAPDAADVPATPDAGASDSDAPGDLTVVLEPLAEARDLPAGVRPPVRILDGTALLMGNGESACTHQTPASGDGHRWCAFTLGPAVGGVADLWVVDVTRAAAGDVPACDGTSPGCLHLTNKAVTRAATFFEGDTLFYDTDAVSGSSPDFLGRVFAWRPGWTAGRQVTSDAGFTCIGNLHSAAAACLDDPGGDPAKRDSANVRAGYLVDGTGGPLPSFGRYPLRNDNDTAWQAGLSPDGSVFVLSNADTIGATQTLRLSPTNAVGQAPPSHVLDDVAYWKVSNDGQKIYFMRGPSQHADLYAADFPSGGNVALIDTDVHAFLLVGDRPSDQGVELVKDLGSAKAVELLADRSVPAPKTIFTFTDFLNGALVSPDLRYTTWLDESFRGTVFRNTDLSTCRLDLDGGSPVFETAYLDAAGLMFWKEIPQSVADTPFRDAYFAPPESCRSKRRFAHDVDVLAPIGDRGVVFTDDRDLTGSRATLEYIAVAPGGADLDPAGAVRVQENVGAPLVLVGANPPILVYPVVGATPETTGLYVFGPVPL